VKLFGIVCLKSKTEERKPEAGGQRLECRRDNSLIVWLI